MLNHDWADGLPAWTPNVPLQPRISALPCAACYPRLFYALRSPAGCAGDTATARGSRTGGHVSGAMLTRTITGCGEALVAAVGSARRGVQDCEHACATTSLCVGTASAAPQRWFVVAPLPLRYAERSRIAYLRGKLTSTILRPSMREGSLACQHAAALLGRSAGESCWHIDPLPPPNMSTYYTTPRLLP